MKNFDRLYKEYLISFENAKEKALKKGEPMFDSERFTRVEFEAMYTAATNDMREEGRTITDKKVIKFLTDRQTYSRSLAQGMALKKAAARRGIELTVHEARVWGGLDDTSGAPENIAQFWNEVKIAQENLKAQGYAGKDIAKFIAIEFFGSPN